MFYKAITGCIAYGFLCLALAQEPLVVPNQVVTTWGYKTTSSQLGTQPQWAENAFGKATIHLQAIKALEEISDWPNAYYDFRLVKEIYTTETAAAYRVENKKQPPPGENPNKWSKTNLVVAFHHQNSAYLIYTRATKFYLEESPRILKLLKAYVSQEP